MRRTTLAALAAACALLAGLTACGGDPQPKFTKSPSPTHAVSASPTPTEPTPPEMPGAARKHTVAGAKAFTRYFWEVANYAQRALDPMPLRSLVSNGCQECQGAVGFIDRVSKGEGTIRGGDASVSNLRVDALAAGHTKLMRVTYTVTNTRQVVDYPGKKKSEVYKAASVTDRWDLSPRPGGWVVISWELVR